MKLNLERLGYFFNDDHQIWTRPNYKGIEYSDGNEVEDYIFNVIKKVEDLSVLSDELKPFCIDWPSLYHLSSNRANILRPFESDLKGDVLEIGAGCGAITRFLGENQGSVLALEGTPRRAAIARARTKDLDNVTVVSEDFVDFKINKKFDVITLIGVLEYANKYFLTEIPELMLLKKIKNLLKPHGKLIIAIENQLGIKYLAGAPEDHIGKPFYGIENQYTKNQPRTYGKTVLNNFLKKSGFLQTEFLYPFPDYKFASSIICNSGLDQNIFKSSYLAFQSINHDPQLNNILSFSPQLLIKEAFKNNIISDLSNSFLVVASNKNKNLISQDLLAYHFNSSRYKKYCKSISFIKKNDKKSISVFTKKLDKDSKNIIFQDYFYNKVKPHQHYFNGILLVDLFDDILAKDNWDKRDLKFLLLRYISILEEITGKKFHLKPNTLISGEYFDCIPQNIIQINKKYIFFDNEWILKRKISLGYLIFRTLLAFNLNTLRFGKTKEKFKKNFIGFCLFSFSSIGWNNMKKDLNIFIKDEFEFQSNVSFSNINLTNFKSNLQASIKFNNLHEQYENVSNCLNQQLITFQGNQSKLMEISDWSVSIQKKDLENQRINQKLLSKDLENQQIIQNIQKELDQFNEDFKKFEKNFILKLLKRIIFRKKSFKEFTLAKINQFFNNIRKKKSTISPSKLLPSEKNGQKNLIIVFPIIPWDFRWQRPQQIMSRLSENGYTILNISMDFYPKGKKIKDVKEAQDILKYNELSHNCFEVILSSFNKLNIYKDKIKNEDLNNMILGLNAAIQKIKPDSIYYFIQFPAWWPIVDNLEKIHKGNILFDCMDEHSGFSNNSTTSLNNENTLIKKSDLVIASSDILKEKCSKINRHTKIIRNGSDFYHFNNPKKNGKLEKLQSKPIIGYYGAISDWFDSSIIEFCAKRKPNWNFVLIGSTLGANLKKLNSLKNVHLLGEINYKDLPGYFAYFDVCTIPFKLVPLTMATNPVKFYEYICSGKPVVSVNLPELIQYKKYCYLSNSKKIFLKNLELAYEQCDDEYKIMERIKLAKENSWDHRVEQIIKEIKLLN